MTSLNLLLWIALGIGLQVGLFLGIGFWRHWQSYSRLKQGLPAIEETPAAAGPVKAEIAGWTGFRAFKVVRRVVEDGAGQICSFYLEPEDGKPLPAYKPGQFLTFRLDLAGADGSGSEQIVRCYSLSDAPQPDRYRVSIKRVPPPPGQDYPPGRSSNFFHDHVRVGTTLQVRAPSGHFYLEPGSGPVVLIAGGIGITPLLSMLDWCQAHHAEREIRFFYGVRNSREAAFAARLGEIAAARPNVHLYVCFSDPMPEDRPGTDFHHRGRVDVALLRMTLPLRPYHYYICGPTPMMESLVAGLEDWGVATANIHYEAFGPASIAHRNTAAVATAVSGGASASDLTVSFARSHKQARWSPSCASLLEFAEAQGIAIDSGCRAGGCGTCQTTILSGEVAYRQAPDYDPEPGSCLMCVCTPKTHVTLEL